MRPSLPAALAAAAISLPAVAQSQALDLSSVLVLAREGAPASQAERLRVDEAASLLAEAELPFAEDPRLDLGLGWREPEDGSDGGHDWSFGVSQRFERSGRREARLDAARVDVDAARSGARDAELFALAQAAELYLRAVHAGERRAALEQDRDLARQELDALQRRARAGAASDLDARLAALNAGRAEGAAAAAAGDEARLLADLAAVLGLHSVAVTGPLEWPWPPDVEAALAAVAQRPDLARLQAEAQRADAEVRLADTASQPDVDARLGYARDDRDRVLSVGFTLGLPLAGRGGGERSAAAARASRVRGLLAAGLRSAEARVRAAGTAYTLLAQAAAGEGDVGGSLDEASRLVTQRWEAGDVGLVELLSLRRELLGTRLAWIDRQLDLALAGLDVDARSGRLLEETP